MAHNQNNYWHIAFFSVIKINTNWKPIAQHANTFLVLHQLKAALKTLGDFCVPPWLAQLPSGETTVNIA